jgi:hypothetical protein
LAEIEFSATVASPQPQWLVVGTAGGIVASASELQVRWFDPTSLPVLEASPEAAAGRLYGHHDKIDWSEETIQIPPPVERTQNYYRTLYATLHDGAEPVVTPSSVRRQIAMVTEARRQTGFF